MITVVHLIALTLLLAVLSILVATAVVGVFSVVRAARRRGSAKRNRLRQPASPPSPVAAVPVVRDQPAASPPASVGTNHKAAPDTVKPQVAPETPRPIATVVDGSPLENGRMLAAPRPAWSAAAAMVCDERIFNGVHAMAAGVAGVRHALRRLPREDAYALAPTATGAVAAVADAVGSAKAARLAAEWAVDAAAATAAAADTDHDWQWVVQDAVGAAVAALGAVEHAVGGRVPGAAVLGSVDLDRPGPTAATLAIARVTGDRGEWATVGDAEVWLVSTDGGLTVLPKHDPDQAAVGTDAVRGDGRWPLIQQGILPLPPGCSLVLASDGAAGARAAYASAIQRVCDTPPGGRATALLDCLVALGPTDDDDTTIAVLHRSTRVGEIR